MQSTEIIDRFLHERTLRGRGVGRIAGIDEAGRGPLAGTVVAAAVILPARWDEEGLPEELDGLNDSKKLTEAQRERFFAFLIECTEVEKGIASIEPTVIDSINILQASHLAMREALAKLSNPPEHVLIDGTPVKSIRLPQTAIVKGDFLSYSIAAASVLAKVTRDREMVQHGETWPGYGFAVHKGYPTPQHLAALENLGPCPIHRRSFGPVAALVQQPTLNLMVG